MLRWLQSLPKYARETEHLSNDALQFRNIIRQAQINSASALFTELPKLLFLPLSTTGEGLGVKSEVAGNEAITRRLRGLMDEINSSYLNLHRRLEQFVVEQFATGEERDYNKGGHAAIVQWIKNTQQHTNADVQAQLFDDKIKSALINAAFNDEASTDNFLDNLTERIVGLPTRDWTDETETQFRQRLTEVKSRVEEELYNRSSNPQELVEISLRLPNSDLRPVEHLRQTRSITVREIPVQPGTYAVQFDRLKAQFRAEPPEMVIITQASNVCGFMLPVGEIAQLSRKINPDVTVIVDGAQVAGLYPLDLNDGLVDYYIFSGHKSLYGPYGASGFVLCTEKQPQPIILGGTGTQSESLEMPNTLPSAYEAGSQNVWAIAGLSAALDWLKEQGREKIVKHCQLSTFFKPNS